ncbi:MAG: hypothetical protein A2007_04765 [Verrucomicrobia bacterium GWC2_42_7]|nr:MAG: hypothetical protein A2007_04765 [Verrucomicrobia bacterium GWC2_42_7]
MIQNRQNREMGFRQKLVLIVCISVLFSLLSSGGIALWNLVELRNRASDKVENDLLSAQRQRYSDELANLGFCVDQFIATKLGELQVLSILAVKESVRGKDLKNDPNLGLISSWIADNGMVSTPVYLFDLEGVDGPRISFKQDSSDCRLLIKYPFSGKEGKERVIQMAVPLDQVFQRFSRTDRSIKNPILVISGDGTIVYASHKDLTPVILSDNLSLAKVRFFPTTEGEHVTPSMTLNGSTYDVFSCKLNAFAVFNSTEDSGKGWFLLSLMPQKELFEGIHQSRKSINDVTGTIFLSQFLVVLLTLCVVILFVLMISRRMTNGLSVLADAVKNIENKDYSIRVNINSGDEIGRLGRAFNNMAIEIETYTTNLSGLVKDRTQELETVSREVIKLNEKLKQENMKLGADIEVTKQLQLMVLPGKDELQAIDKLDIVGFMHPADEVGGDYYDVLRFEEVTKIGMGDVTGHGIESGVLMLMVQTIAKSLLEAKEYNPIKFLELLNRVLFANIHRINTDKNLTLLFADFYEDHFILSGQHEEVIVIRADGALERLNTMDLGFPIGLEEDIHGLVSSQKVDFRPGDVVVFFTDGITEAIDMNNEQFGIERLCNSIQARYTKKAAEIKDGVIRDLMLFIGRQKIHDDISLLVVKHK